MARTLRGHNFAQGGHLFLGHGLSGLNAIDRLFSGAGAGVGFYYNFLNPQTLYTNTGRTTLVSATGQEVAGVTDLSGSGNHAYQDGAAKPTYESTGTLYDGVADALKVDAVTGLTATMSVSALIKTTDDTGIILGAQDDVGENIIIWASGGTAQTYGGTVGTPSLYVDGSDQSGITRPALRALIADNSWHVVRQTGLVMTDASWQNIFVGIRNGAGVAFAGSIGALIVTASTNSADLAAADTYLGSLPA